MSKMNGQTTTPRGRSLGRRERKASIKGKGTISKGTKRQISGNRGAGECGYNARGLLSGQGNAKKKKKKVQRTKTAEAGGGPEEKKSPQIAKTFRKK